MKRRTNLLIVLTAMLLVPASLWAQEVVPPAPILTANHKERTVSVSWEAVPGAARYELFAWDKPNGWQKLDDGSLTATSFEHNELEANVQYYYTYRAHYSSGDVGAWSEYSSVVIAPPLRAPVLTAVLDGNAVSLSWGEVAEGANYELWVWNSVTKWKRLEHSFSGTTFRHENVVPGTTYYYTARAQDSAGQYSAWSEYAIVEIPISTAATATPTVTPTAKSTQTPTTTLTPTATPTEDLAQKDRAVLVTLYNSTNGAYWWDKRNWLTNTPLSRWDGVDTDRSGRVASLKLFDKNLNGIIPPELGDLANLRTLDLHNNRRLQGSIPSELGNLANLHTLQLSNTQLSGSIPPELGDIPHLHSLFLGHSELNGAIPPQLGNLSNLNAMSLHGNSLTGSIPAGLGNLANLRSLDLANNELSGSIPAGLGNLDNLTHLDLYGNNLTGTIPAELGNLARLSALSLLNNELSGAIPPELSNLTNLYRLNLRNNNLRGSIPPELGEITGLFYLDLQNNNLSGTIPPELGDIVNLHGLYLRGNNFSGCIPPALNDVPNNDLGQLNLPDCQE